ncbi:uncharacterized protein LOC143205272 [Rhynchophorus ferrugineus]|uniref:uncharacterized protein LOC143205272 n=1 Tax=Rhynchophorus ferrugineus TaxID=354439 RepID=UPI003FCE9207
MMKFVTVVGFCLIGITIAMPASNEQLDKATVNDVSVNSVSEEKKGDPAQQQSEKQEVIPSTVEISGITTGVNPVPANPAAPTNTSKPQRSGSMFARFIDDIFQIPITVLQNVAKLITNPFTQSKKEAGR